MRKRIIAERVEAICYPRRAPASAHHLLTDAVSYVSTQTARLADGIHVQALLAEAAALSARLETEGDGTWNAASLGAVGRMREIDQELVTAMAKIGQVYTPKFQPLETYTEDDRTALRQYLPSKVEG